MGKLYLIYDPPGGLDLNGGEGMGEEDASKAANQWMLGVGGAVSRGSDRSMGPDPLGSLRREDTAAAPKMGSHPSGFTEPGSQTRNSGKGPPLPRRQRQRHT